MARLIDRLLARASDGRPYMNEDMASAAAIWMGPAEQRNREQGASYEFKRQVTDCYRANGVLFSVILARMMLFSEATFKFQRKSDRTLYGNETLRLLEYPWPNGTTGELLARMEQDVSLAGNAFIRRVTTDDGDELRRIRPDSVLIVSREEEDDLGRPYRRVIGYTEDPRLIGEEGEPHTYDVDEVAHWSPIPDPLASFRGMSWLTPIIREVQADQDLVAYKSTHIRTGAMPGIVLKYQQKLSESVISTLRTRFQAKYGGPENAGKTIVLDEGADMTVAGSNLEQLQFVALQAAGETRIAAAGGVPPIVAGLKEGLSSATYSNYEQSMRRFADLTMRPNWRSVCACLEHLVRDVPERGVRLWFDVSDIAALRQGELDRAQTLLVRAQAVAALVAAGYKPESAVAAVEAMDLTKLEALPAGPPAPGPGRPAGTMGAPETQPGVTAQPLPAVNPAPRQPAIMPPLGTANGRNRP